MKKALFLCALLMLPAAAIADSISMACNNGPKLVQYQLPTDANGLIDFAKVSLLESTELFNSLPTAESGDPQEVRWVPITDLDIVPVGSPICLTAGSDDIHLLQVGYGSGIPLGNKASVIQVIYAMERAAFAEGTYVEKAYLDRAGS